MTRARRAFVEWIEPQVELVNSGRTRIVGYCNRLRCTIQEWQGEGAREVNNGGGKNPSRPQFRQLYSTCKRLIMYATIYTWIRISCRWFVLQNLGSIWYFHAPFNEKNYCVGFDWVSRSAYVREPCPTSAFKFTVLLFLSRLRNSLWLSRILNHEICIVIRAIELHVELQLRFFQLQVML
jgi:hypothetical protein